MAAYVIADIEIKDPTHYEEYRKQVMPTLAAYGGNFLVRGGAAERLEGSWEPKRIIVLEFESAAKAREWWFSPEYEGPKALRRRLSEGSLILVEGV